MSVKIEKIVDKNFGNCVMLSNGLIELMVTVDFGPRILHCSVCGKENMFYQDLSKGKLGPKQDVYDDQLQLYGGHRLWISPEVLPRCYYPDSDPAECTEIKNGMRFAAPVEKINNIQKIISIVLDENLPKVELDHMIINCGVWDIELAPWCLTMMDRGGVEVIPMPNRKTGLLHNRSITLWEYSEMNDSRVYWGKDYITLAYDESKSNPFKLGLCNEAGWGAHFNKGQVFVKSFKPIIDGFYPDNGCCYESYTCKVMTELETLGELAILEPGESAEVSETWAVYEADGITNARDENEIAQKISKFLK